MQPAWMNGLAVWELMVVWLQGQANKYWNAMQSLYCLKEKNEAAPTWFSGLCNGIRSCCGRNGKSGLRPAKCNDTGRVSTLLIFLKANHISSQKSMYYIGMIMSVVQEKEKKRERERMYQSHEGI